MRRLRLLLASGVFALLVLGVIEFGVRLSGVAALPAHHSSLPYQALRLPLFEPAESDGSFLVPADRRIAWDFIESPKPAGTLRIVVCGGSAVAGLGASPNAAFPRYLERMLVKLGGDRPVEVLNLGVVGIASKQVLALVQDACESLEPDVVVVYSGNNEFLEVHAEEYQRATRGRLSRLSRKLSRLHLLRAFAQLLRGPHEIPPARLTEAADGDDKDPRRVSQVEMLSNIDMPRERIDGVLDLYEANLEAMVAAARSSGARIVLANVASNWCWLGEEDPVDWEANYVGKEGLSGDELRQEALDRLDRELAATPPLADKKAYVLLHHRARLRAASGDMEGARADWRASMNRDPHLRRALDKQNERVREVAERNAVPFFDAVAALAESDAHGVIGFELFYDYVHFTDRGALTMAGGLAELLAREKIISRASPTAFIERELSELERRTHDWPEVERFLGFAFEPALRTERNLWKYDRLLEDLGRRAENGPDRALAWIYRGNIHALRPDGREEAQADYRRALELEPDHAAALANLSRLSAEPAARSQRTNEE